MDDINIIIKPLVTEKSTHIQETRNSYAFQVERHANKIQIRNGLRPTSLTSGDFTVEMETGTGKTYVYLRTALDLKQAKPGRGFGGRSQRVPGAEQRSAAVEPCDLSLLHRCMFPFWVGRCGGAGASGLRLQGRLSAT